MSTIQDLREDYTLGELSKEVVGNEPISFFQEWFEVALKANVEEPNAMVLSTVDKNGCPDARVVLLKSITEKGFIFYTNFNSKKAQDILANENISITFLWKTLQRQVRIQGKATKISDETADKYFQSRPYKSKIGAWTSPQSEIIQSRTELESLEAEYKTKFSTEVPKPPHWGGFIIEPLKVEFWQGRTSRLHDRIVFSRENIAQNDWEKVRVAP